MKALDADAASERASTSDGNCDKIAASSGKRLVSLHIIDVTHATVGGPFVGFSLTMCSTQRLRMASRTTFFNRNTSRVAEMLPRVKANNGMIARAILAEYSMSSTSTSSCSATFAVGKILHSSVSSCFDMSAESSSNRCFSLAVIRFTAIAANTSIVQWRNLSSCGRSSRQSMQSVIISASAAMDGHAPR